MVKKLYTESNIEDIADAIREKNGSSATYTTAQMPAAIRAIPTTGGGNIVNGIIEYYKAKTGTISANTFVEFVAASMVDGINVGVSAQISSANYSASYVSACALDENRVFVAYTDADYNLYAQVCTISGTTITTGTDTRLTGVNIRRTNALLIDEDTVCVVYGDSGGSLYGEVCTISGTTITTGGATGLALDSDVAGGGFSAAALGTNKIFVTYRKRVSGTVTTDTLNGLVCGFMGTTIIQGTGVQLSDVGGSYRLASSTALDSSTVFVVHKNGNYLYGLVCAISGSSTITAGTDTQLGALSEGYGNPSAVALDSSTVFVAHYNGSYLYGVACTISGTTITAGTDTQLSEASGVAYYTQASAVALDSSTVFVAQERGTDVRGVACTISGTTITAGTDTQLVAGSASSVAGHASAALVDTNKVFVAYAYGSYSTLSAVMATGNKGTIKASTTKIEGLTKTQATTSTAGDVWVLNN